MEEVPSYDILPRVNEINSLLEDASKVTQQLHIAATQAKTLLNGNIRPNVRLQFWSNNGDAFSIEIDSSLEGRDEIIRFAVALLGKRCESRLEKLKEIGSKL